MSGLAPIRPADTAVVGTAAPAWHVRDAREEDVEQITGAVAELLVELGGTPPPAMAMQQATRALLEDAGAGALLVAEAEDAIVGVLAVSWQTAIHVSGRYGLIQDLWVHPAWRSRAIGAAMLDVLVELMRERRMTRVEVGLPREGYTAIAATEGFYRASGFTSLGPRMRKVLE